MTLKEWMKKEGIKNNCLAEKLGISRVSVSRYRNGKIPPESVIKSIRDLSNKLVEPNSFYQ